MQVSFSSSALFSARHYPKMKVIAHVLKSAFEFERQLTKDMITIVLFFFSYFMDLQLRTKIEIRVAVEPTIYRSKYPNRQHRYKVL